MSAIDGSTASSLPTSKVTTGKLIRWSIVALVAIGAVAIALHFWRQSLLYVSTDNAYVNANKVEIAASRSMCVISKQCTH